MIDLEGFFCGTNIHSGPGAVGCLGKLAAGRLLVVTDPFFHKNGTAQRLAQLAKPTACEYFHKITPDPTATLAAEGAAVVRSFGPDAVLALGGGSAMDCAKAMVYFSETEVPLIAIPTTSGSGAEVTDFAILTHDGIKHPLVDSKLRPTHAIIDPDLVESLPRKLIAEGGFDMLTHAVESFTARNATPFSDALALSAFRTGIEDLHSSWQADQAARAKVHHAATMAAVAFNNSGLGVCHALSHSLGGQFHLSHGLLNAILLPAVIDQTDCPKYALLAKLAGIEGASQTIAKRNLVTALTRLRKTLHLPGTLAEAGISPDQLQPQLERILTAALEDPCCATAPQAPTRQYLHRIMQRVAG